MTSIENRFKDLDKLKLKSVQESASNQDMNLLLLEQSEKFPINTKKSFQLKIEPFQWKGTTSYLISMMDVTENFQKLALNDFIFKDLTRVSSQMLSAIETDY